MKMAGSILKNGVNYSNGGLKNNAFDVSFVAENTNMVSNNVNDAINELARIVTNAVEQFNTHRYELGSDRIASLKTALVESSRRVGGMCMFELATGENVEYIGSTMTTSNECSFILHKIADPSVRYYGYFNNMSTGAADSFKMYDRNGVEQFSKSGFTI